MAGVTGFGNNNFDNYKMRTGKAAEASAAAEDKTAKETQEELKTPNTHKSTVTYSPSAKSPKANAAAAYASAGSGTSGDRDDFDIRRASGASGGDLKAEMKRAYKRLGELMDKAWATKEYKAYVKAGQDYVNTLYAAGDDVTPYEQEKIDQAKAACDAAEAAWQSTPEYQAYKAFYRECLERYGKNWINRTNQL